MQCERCGAQNPKDMRFCENCGNRLIFENVSSQVQGMHDAVKKKKSGKKIWISMVAVVVIAAIAVGVWFFLRPDEDAKKSEKLTSVQSLEKYFDAILEADAEKIWEFAASPYTKYWNMDEEEKKEEIKKIKENYEEQMQRFKAENTEVSYKDCEKIKTYDENEVEKIAAALYEEDDRYNTREYALQAVEVVRFVSIVEQEDETEEEIEEIVMFRIDGKWYLEFEVTSEEIEELL